MMTRARYAWDHWLGPQVTSSREVSVWLTWNREAALGSFCAKLPLRFFNEMRNLSSRRENQAKQLQAYKVLAVSRTFSEKVSKFPVTSFLTVRSLESDEVGSWTTTVQFVAEWILDQFHRCFLPFRDLTQLRSVNTFLSRWCHSCQSKQLSSVNDPEVAAAPTTIHQPTVNNARALTIVVQRRSPSTGFYATNGARQILRSDRGNALRLNKFLCMDRRDCRRNGCLD